MNIDILNPDPMLLIAIYTPFPQQGYIGHVYTKGM